MRSISLCLVTLLSISQLTAAKSSEASETTSLRPSKNDLNVAQENERSLFERIRTYYGGRVDVDSKVQQNDPASDSVVEEKAIYGLEQYYSANGRNDERQLYDYDYDMEDGYDPCVPMGKGKGSEGDGSKGSKGDGSKGSKGDGSKGSKGDGSKGSKGDGSKGGKGSCICPTYSMSYDYVPSKGGTSKGDTSKGDTSKGSKGDTSKGSKGDTSKGSKGDASKGSKGDTSKGSKGDTSKGSKGDTSKGDTSKGSKGDTSKGDTSKGSKGDGRKGDTSKGSEGATYDAYYAYDGLERRRQLNSAVPESDEASSNLRVERNSPIMTPEHTDRRRDLLDEYDYESGVSEGVSGKGSEGSSKGSKGSSKGSEGVSKGSGGVSKGSEGSSKGSEGSSKGSKGSSKGSEGSSKGSEGYSKGSEGYSKGSEGSSKGSKASSKGSEGSSKGSEGSSKGSKGSSKGSSSKGKGTTDEEDCVCEEPPMEPEPDVECDEGPTAGPTDGPSEGDIPVVLNPTAGPTVGPTSEERVVFNPTAGPTVGPTSEERVVFNPTAGPTAGPSESMLCPSGDDLAYYLEQVHRNWTEHLEYTEGLEGCWFGAITTPGEQEEVEGLIKNIYGVSGFDFIWFGAYKCDGEVAETNRGDENPQQSNSTWCWIRDSSLTPFGGGTNANNTSLGYENWAPGNEGDGFAPRPQPNNNAGNQGVYAGFYSGAVVPPSEQWGWNDATTGSSWHGLYQCCPENLPLRNILISEISTDDGCNWIELYYAGPRSEYENMVGYQLEYLDFVVTFPAFRFLAEKYVLLSRDGCATVSAVSGVNNQSFDFSLAESGTITLKDSYGNIVDQVNYDISGGVTAAREAIDGPNGRIVPKNTGDFAQDFIIGQEGGTPMDGYE